MSSAEDLNISDDVSSSSGVSQDIENSRLFNSDIGTINRMNFQDLSEGDIKKLSSIISKCINDRFSKYEGVSDATSKLSKRILMSDPQAESRVGGEIGRNIDDFGFSGIYHAQFHHVFLGKNYDKNLNGNENCFQVWLHESLHFVSQENGAGFYRFSENLPDNFSIPDEYLDDDLALETIAEGVRVLCEGSTQNITEDSEFDMGFPAEDISVDAYPVETQIVSRIINLIGEEKFHEIYFTMPLEELRFKFEALNKDEYSEYEDLFLTGDFAGFLMEIADCNYNCYSLLSNKEPDLEKVDSCINKFIEHLAEYLGRTSFSEFEKDN